MSKKTMKHVSDTDGADEMRNRLQYEIESAESDMAWITAEIRASYRNIRDELDRKLGDEGSLLGNPFATSSVTEIPVLMARYEAARNRAAMLRSLLSY
jgi:hypothetical protein